MPKIPNATAIQREIPIDKSGVARYQPDLQVAGAFNRAGASVQRSLDRRTGYQVAKAESQFLIAQTEQDNAYDEDPDYEGIQSKYEGAVNNTLGELAGNISDPTARNAFVQSQQVRIAAGTERMRDLSLSKERDFERGAVNDQMNALRETALTGDIGAANANAKNILAAGVEAGYYKHEEVSKMYEAWRQDAALGRLETMSPEDRTEALKQDWAKNLPSDTRATLIRKAEADTRAGKASASVDEYMFKDLSQEDAMGAASKIKNDAQRRATEARVDYAYSRKDMFEQKDQIEVHEKYYSDVRQGNLLVKDIPNLGVELKKMTPAQINNLYAAQAGAVKPARASSNRTVLLKLHNLYENKKFSELKNYFLANSATLKDSDYNSWAKVSEKGDAPIQIKSMFTATQQLAREIDKLGITFGIGEDELKTDAMDKLGAWYTEYQERNEGRLPDDNARDKKIDELLMTFDPSLTFSPSTWFTKERIAKMDDIEYGTFIATKRAFESFKVNPTKDNFIDKYNSLLSSRRSVAETLKTTKENFFGTGELDADDEIEQDYFDAAK